MFYRYFLIAVSLVSLAACTPGDAIPEVKDGQYWQRANASESVYMQGPKAQQLLNRSIANCVVELRELERLGMVRDAIPADLAGRVLDPDQQALDNWDTPERDGALFAEHSDYHDFEGCMLAKGWERVEYLPYDVAIKSRRDYLNAQKSFKYNSKYGEDPNFGQRGVPSSMESSDYSNLND